MSQMHQLTACPSCEEPLDTGDRFCGACGYDLSAAAEPPRAGGPDGTPPVSVEWPMVATGDGSRAGGPAPVHRPADLPGLDSSGSELPTAEPPARADGPPAPREAPPMPREAPPAPAGTDAYSLQEPEPHEPTLENPLPSAPADPRTAVRPDPAAESAGKVCVACRTGYVDTDGYCERCGHAQPRERDHMERELDAVSAVSDRGLRHHRNEDAFAVSATALPDGSPAVVAVVCDGVSSASRPDEASAAASRAANESLLDALPRGTHPQTALHEAIVAAATAVNSLAGQPEGSVREHAPHQNSPACTIVGSVVAGGLLAVGWVGDSRAYWVPDDRSGPAARLTEDDSWAAQMVAAGLMNETQAYADERAHAITGWLGADAYELDPHTASFKPDRPGVVVVCTDGLWNYAESAEEMAAVLPPDAAARPLHAARVLVGHALDGGGHDNVTVAVLPFPVTP